MSKKKTTEIETSENKIDTLIKDVKKTNPLEVLIISLQEDGHIGINSTIHNFPVIHYLLNRAEFETLVFEKNNLLNKVQGEGAE